MLVIGIIAGVLGLALIAGAAVVVKKRMSGAGAKVIEDQIQEVQALSAEIETLIAGTEHLISKAQLDNAKSQLESLKTSLAGEKEALEGLEQKLTGAQKNVEQKEAVQQDIKSAKSDDEKKVAELLAAYQDHSNDSVQLEQKLALSLKNLDSIMSELNLNQDQRAVLQDLSTALTQAGSRLRDLIMEYQQVHERLQALDTQHRDLEEEYTRLVEQQLGD